MELSDKKLICILSNPRLLGTTKMHLCFWEELAKMVYCLIRVSWKFSKPKPSFWSTVLGIKSATQIRIILGWKLQRMDFPFNPSIRARRANEIERSDKQSLQAFKSRSQKVIIELSGRLHLDWQSVTSYCAVDSCIFFKLLLPPHSNPCLRTHSFRPERWSEVLKKPSDLHVCSATGCILSPRGKDSVLYRSPNCSCGINLVDGNWNWVLSQSISVIHTLLFLKKDCPKLIAGNFVEERVELNTISTYFISSSL